MTESNNSKPSYVVCWGKNPVELEAMVSEWVDRGYITTGGVAVMYWEAYDEQRFYQAVKLPDTQHRTIRTTRIFR